MENVLVMQIHKYILSIWLYCEQPPKQKIQHFKATILFSKDVTLATKHQCVSLLFHFHLAH